MCVSRWRSVIGRFGGRVCGLPAASKPVSTCASAMAGTTALAGVSRLSLPRSTHCTAATEVMALVIEAIRKPIEVGNRQYLLGVSVGIAHFPDHAANMEGLMQRADIAMYQAKQAGGRAYRFADRIASPVANASVHSQPSDHPQESKPTH